LWSSEFLRPEVLYVYKNTSEERAVSSFSDEVSGAQKVQIRNGRILSLITRRAYFLFPAFIFGGPEKG
jgi:hypothetical protein